MRSWKGPVGCSLLVWAALALVAAPPAVLLASAEEGVEGLELRCDGEMVSVLEARGAPVDSVLRALERECGLQLEGAGNIPDRPVTATYQKVTLEEVIEAIIRLTDLPNTLLATASSGVLKLAVLATTGREASTRRLQAPKGLEASNGFPLYDQVHVREAVREDSIRQFHLGQTERQRQFALAILRQVDPAEAWILQQSDEEELAAERAEVAAEVAIRQFFLAGTEQERQRALADLVRLDPDEADYLQDLTAEELAENQNDSAIEAARRKFLLAQTNKERQRALAELKVLDPDEAEALLME